MPRRDKDHLATRRLCTDAAMLGFSLILSYVEAVLPIAPLIPLPGFKLGLANVAVMLVFWMFSPADAAAVLTLRVIISSMLFGSPISLLFSAAGGALSYASLFATRPFASRGKLSFLGVSVASAACNALGQIVAAMTVYTPAAASYLPVMLALGCFTGALTGGISNLIYPKLERILNVKKSS